MFQSKFAIFLCDFFQEECIIALQKSIIIVLIITQLKSGLMNYAFKMLKKCASLSNEWCFKIENLHNGFNISIVWLLLPLAAWLQEFLNSWFL